MRCVLPHIPDPWAFLQLIAESSTRSLVLIEFQRLEWIIENDIWFQIGHGHCNYFTAVDFECRYNVINQGQFSNGEWGWVLIDPASFHAPVSRECLIASDLDALLSIRERTLHLAAKNSGPLAIWGGAGKGAILGHALQTSLTGVVAAVDAHPNRWGRFLESSGIPLISPESALHEFDQSTTVLVCNPNHLEDVRNYVGEGFNVFLPAELI